MSRILVVAGFAVAFVAGFAVRGIVPGEPVAYAQAPRVLKEVLFEAVLFIGGQFPVKIKWYQFRDRIARHTKSPSTERIFCVARKRQFLAASSVVPNISPILRKRSP